MSGALRLNETVQLRNASLIVGLSGWGNAGEVSTFSVTYLIEKLKASQLGEIASEKFYDYQLQRPQVSVEGGLLRGYWPLQNRFFYWRGKERGLLLLLGAEPHLDWPGYAQAVLEATETVGARRIYTIGGYIIGIPHTGEPLITGSTNNPECIPELRRANVELTDYKGPTSVYSEILWQGKARGFDVVSLWGAVPLYVQGSNPKVALHILRKLAMMIDIELDLKDMEQKAEALDAQLAAEAEQNPELRQLIESLRAGRRAPSTRPSYTV